MAIDGPAMDEPTPDDPSAEFDALLQRAAQEVREDDDNDSWLRVTESIFAKVRASTRHSVPLRAELSADLVARGDQLFITDIVVKQILRDALEGIGGTAPLRMHFDIDNGICQGIEIDLTAEYGTDLKKSSRDIRNLVHEVLRVELGSAATTPENIKIHIADVTDERF
ncbi:hypothetical protein IEU95_01200 [Hoyosella rhizosphaerae]|uniref:Uncharacterized protein n=1 Tax=Hoyosella rhizosphaerae TaxID=1755582 RepID=A0A916UK43_9ACTN|nr:hypothetical protein [Hoyosella rhizosphaerae]MBN4925434.1 hypothetical protein [Hoyosella rhizosphaerae]GGC75230.1 hypothetical protein GCM10011410_30670 [Hoyosella rhizosphaerae]